MALERILVCDDYDPQTGICNSSTAIEGYIMEPDQADFILNGGIDWESVYWASGQSLSCFVIGITFGLIVNIIKKAR